jgi:hypothetical protein
VTLAKLFTFCAKSSPFTDCLFSFFYLALEGQTDPIDVFFDCLKLFPSFSKIMPAYTFNHTVSTLLLRVLDEQTYSLLRGKDRNSIHKFIRGLLKCDNPALVSQLAHVVRFLLRSISHPLEALEIPIDDATDSVYFILRRSVETGVAVCYAKSAVDDIADAFCVLKKCLRADCPGIPAFFNDIFNAYTPWLDRVAPPLLRLNVFSVGIGLFRYRSFDDPASSEFALSFYQKLIDALPTFLETFDDFYNALQEVYAALHFFARFLPTAENVPLAAVGVITRTLPEIERMKDEFIESERIYPRSIRDSFDIEVTCLRIAVVIGKFWPAVVAQFPVAEPSRLPGCLAFGLATVAAVRAPQLVSPELGERVRALFELLMNPRSIAFGLYLYGELARADCLEVGIVPEIFRMLESEFSEGEERLSEVAEGIVMGMIGLLTKYSTVVYCEDGWNLFWRALEMPLDDVQVLSTADAIQDLEVLVDGLGVVRKGLQLRN